MSARRPGPGSRWRPKGDGNDKRNLEPLSSQRFAVSNPRPLEKPIFHIEGGCKPWSKHFSRPASWFGGGRLR